MRPEILRVKPRGFGKFFKRLVPLTSGDERQAKDVMQDLFAGTQNYLDLKKRLMNNLSGSLVEVSTNIFLRRMVAGEA